MMQNFLTTYSTQAKEKSIIGKSTKKSVRQPWVEKYRPKCVDDVAYQEEVVAVLKTSLSNQDLPNLLFYGPPGTGKTSTILALARELFGDIYNERILELNASDERGINVVRDKIKTFSQLTASSTRPDGRQCPPLKIIILDEADSMTAPAQAALRRTMEKESRTTRFCLICNYVSRIIEPITSRCAKFRFKPLSDDILLSRLKAICQTEMVKCNEEAFKSIIETSEGDMRKAISCLQSAARMKGSDEISKRDIIEIAGVIDQTIIEELFDSCQSGSYDKIQQTTKKIMSEGHSAGQLILQLHDYVLEMDHIDNKQKSFMLQRIAVVDKKLVDGADEYLQILDLCTVILHQLTS